MLPNGGDVTVRVVVVVVVVVTHTWQLPGAGDAQYISPSYGQTHATTSLKGPNRCLPGEEGTNKPKCSAPLMGFPGVPSLQ